MGRKSVKLTTRLWWLWKRFCLSDSSSHHVTPGFMTFHYSLIQYSSCAFVLRFKIVRFIIGLVWDPKLFLELARLVLAVWMLSEQAIIRSGPAPPSCQRLQEVLKEILAERPPDKAIIDPSHHERAWTTLHTLLNSGRKFNLVTSRNF